MTTVLNYKQWKEYITSNTPHDELIDCPQCHGEGVYEHYCDECDNYSEKSCDECDETGNLRFGDIVDSKGLLARHFTEGLYKEHLIKDLTDLASWIGEDRIKVLVEHGLKVYSNIESKREQIYLH